MNELTSPFAPGTFRSPPERTEETAPYFRLWAAVLYRGCADFATARMGLKSDQDRAEFRASEVYDWILSPHDNRRGSFVWICSMLGLNPERARNAVIANSRAIYLQERRGANNKEEKLAKVLDREESFSYDDSIPRKRNNQGK